MPFQIIRNDITKVRVDAIVNTANPRPMIGGGTDSAIYTAAGEKELLAARMEIGNISPGACAVTSAFNLPAKYIIHTVGPIWEDGTHGEREVLRSCYANSLSLSSDLDCSSIAFPMISTGVYGFPKDEALDIALAEIGKFLLTHEMNIFLVVFDRKSLELSQSLVGEIEQYIGEHEVRILNAREYRDSDRTRRIQAERHLLAREEIVLSRECTESCVEYSVSSSPTDQSDFSGKTLEELLGKKEDTFQQRLFKLIDASGMDDVTVYKKANIDRKVFSRIRCKEDYKPTKKTAVAFAIALQLDMPTMVDLLSRAEIA